jgi:stress-induced morphogen
MVVKLGTERPDEVLQRIAQALQGYDAAHPRAKIDVYRQNSVSVRIRIIASDFKGKSRAEREDDLWRLLDQLTEELIAEISLLLMLTPEEAKTSFANQEFENPIPSKL